MSVFISRRKKGEFRFCLVWMEILMWDGILATQGKSTNILNLAIKCNYEQPVSFDPFLGVNYWYYNYDGTPQPDHTCATGQVTNECDSVLSLWRDGWWCKFEKSLHHSVFDFTPIPSNGKLNPGQTKLFFLVISKKRIKECKNIKILYKFNQFYWQK